MRSLVFVLLLVTTAEAAPPKPRAVIAPIAATGHDPEQAKLTVAVERALIEAARAMAGVELVNADANRLKGPSRIDAKADPRPQARAQALARELSADLAISAEPQPLGDGAVVYLQVSDGSGRPRGSTTVALSAEVLRSGGAELERPLRGGLLQILDPKAFVGALEVKVDVNGAQLEIDGRATPLPHSGRAIPLPVGPHALRVTHPAYRDFLRFVEIGFDRTESQQVTMAAFPLTEGEMDEKRKRGGGRQRKMPWYRSWWALSITGVVLAGATAGIAYAARPTLSADHTTTYKVVPAP